MTAHPIPENARCWWLTAGKWRRLHAIPEAAITREQMDTALDTGTPVRARAVCGLKRRWWMPGVISRMTKPRCVPCCRTLGIPPGCGTPANQASRTRLYASADTDLGQSHAPTRESRSDPPPRPATPPFGG